MQYNISIQSLQDKLWGKMFTEVKYKMCKKNKDIFFETQAQILDLFIKEYLKQSVKI